MVEQEFYEEVKSHVVIPEGYEEEFELLKEMASNPCKGVEYDDGLETITEDFKKQHERMKAVYDRFVEALEAAENESVRESVQRVREDKG